MSATQYTHRDPDGMKWRFVGGRPVSELADKVMQAASVPQPEQHSPGRWTYANVLEFAKDATIVTWYRDTNCLCIMKDNFAKDRRTVVELRTESLTNGAVQERTLCEYDKVRNRWNRYCDPTHHCPLPDRKGRKALLGWIRTQAKARTGFPNPPILTFQPQKEGTL